VSQSEAGWAATVDTDVDLTVRALAGEQGAFEELYRRHAPAAWRVARAVAGDADDAADAVSDAFTRVLAAVRAGRYSPEAPFRPYLLTATRNAAIDGLRRRGRTDTADVIDLTERRNARAGHDRIDDPVVEGIDRALVARAFQSLPDRWRAVLWLTEVEGIPPRDAAAMLGLSANGVAQLAVRARAGLRSRYLQAHLGSGAVGDADCRRTIRHLGAYVAGTLAPRDVARVDQHLAGCAECRERVEELREVGGAMAMFAIPLPAAVALAAAQRWRAWLAASSSQSSGAAAWLAPRGRLARTASGWAAGVVALGLLSLPDWRGGDPPTDEAGAADRPLTGEVGEPPVDEVVVLATTLSADPGATVRRPPRTVPSEPDPTGDEPPPVSAAPPPVLDPDPTVPPPAQPGPERTEDPVVGVAAGAAVDGTGVAVSVGVGGGCTGATAGPSGAGCATSPPAETGVVVQTDGSAAPPVEARLP